MNDRAPRPGFWSELKRRKVFHVAGAYAATAFVVLQVTSLVVEPLGLPAWTQTLVVFLAAVGFPIALVLAWAFEVTPDGVRREGPAAGDADGDPGAPAPDDGPGPVRSPAERRPRELAAVFAGGIVLALVGFGAYAYLGDGPGDRTSPVAADDRQLSVAVLPFTDMSREPDQAFLADGITEDVLTRLAQIGSLGVISRTSVMRYRGSEKSVREIARELGVTHVLEGSVRRAGERVRITGQLIDAHTDEHLWAESYDRTLDDVFDVQAEIAGEIARALEVRLSAEDRSRLDRKAPASPRAYELYLRGREYLHANFQGPAEWNDHRVAAAALFRQALVEDSTFPPAWAGLARAYRERDDLPRADRYDSAVAFARRATRLDPALADGYVQLGQAYSLRGQDEAGIEQVRYALELNPSHADALLTLAEHEAYRGRMAEAVRLYRRATRVAPNVYQPYLGRANAWLALGEPGRSEGLLRKAFGEVTDHPARMHCHLAYVELTRRDTAAARAHRDRSTELAPDAPYAHRCAAIVSLVLGKHDVARRWFERFAETAPPEDERPRIPLAYLARLSGDTARARALLDEAESLLSGEIEASGLDPSDHVHRARILAGRGDRDGALEQLRRAVEAGWRRSGDVALTLDPTLAPVRDDPRFRDLVREIEADLQRQRRELEEEELAPIPSS